MKQGRTDAEIQAAISDGRDAYQEYTLIKKKAAQHREIILEAIANTKPNDDIGRKNLWQGLQVWGIILKYLDQDINDGKLAMKQLDEIRRVGRPSIIERILP